MFEWLDKFPIILVTGPARSGTKICARMIAQDAGHTYVDEHDIGYSNKNQDVLCERLEQARHDKEKIVVQCPGWFLDIAIVADSHDVLVIVMRRIIQDIINSWMALGVSRPEKLRKHLPEIYEYYDERVRPDCKNVLDVTYESLSAHPLWVRPEDRKHWKRNDEWRVRRPCLLLLSIRGLNERWAKQMCGLLRSEGIDATIYETNLNGDGIFEHIFGLDWRPHYAILSIGRDTEPDNATMPAKIAGCKTVVVCDGDVARAKADPSTGIIVINREAAASTLYKIGMGAYPRNIIGVLWREPVTKVWLVGG